MSPLTHTNLGLINSVLE